MHRILVTEDLPPEAMKLLDAPDVRADLLRPSRAELRDCIGDYDGLIVRWMTRVDSDLLERAPRLKVIGRAGASLDNVDLEAATRRGIIVTNTPLMHSTASAEYTLGLLLALARKIPQAHNAVQAGEWLSRRQYIGVELAGKTLGLVGFGRVGREVAARAGAFGLNVIAYDPYLDDAVVRGTEVMLVDLDELLARSDFISLHAPLTEETKRLIGVDEILQMKDGVYLINTARGALIDEDAVVVGVKTGKVAGAAMDAFTREPPVGSSLLGLPNVITTPHLGASTHEALSAIATQIVAQTLDALRGADYRNVVNLPFVEGAEFKAIRPYLVLAEKVGALQRQLAGGEVKRVEVEARGSFAGLIKPLTMALLKGLMGQQANYINAPALAAERGLVVTQAKGLPLIDYPNLISCRVAWPEGARLIAGTLFANEEARIAQMDGFRLDGLPVGTVLVMTNDDVPGVIGRVGTLLGARSINIAEWRLGRDRPGGRALSFINLDNDAPAPVLAELRDLPGIAEVWVVRL
jgi:D-3-phosphoglycerate dehydrogenase / 2-oxoglutarate reductase